MTPQLSKFPILCYFAFKILYLRYPSSVQAACAAAGINSCKLVKTTTIQDQEQAAMAFRGPESDLDAVVASFNSSKGLRASHACRNGILVQYPRQFSTYAEVTSVLTYPDQVDKPVWDVALVNETLDVVEEAALALRLSSRTNRSTLFLMPSIRSSTRSTLLPYVWEKTTVICPIAELTGPTWKV